MPQRSATIDSTCLIALESLGLLPALASLFGRIWIPKAVREETAKRGRRKHKIASVVRKYAFFGRCDVTDWGRVELLLSEAKTGSRKPKQHRGEAEAVIQATERGATTVLVDDPRGRQWADRHGLHCHGTLWVLCELRRIGVLAALRPIVAQLRQSGFRLPALQVRTALRQFGGA